MRVGFGLMRMRSERYQGAVIIKQDKAPSRSAITIKEVWLYTLPEVTRRQLVLQGLETVQGPEKILGPSDRGINLEPLLHGAIPPNLFLFAHSQRFEKRIG